MQVTPTKNEAVANMVFAAIYPLYLSWLDKKGRTQAELDRVIEWFTGFDRNALQALLDEKATYQTFFQKAEINANAHLIKGVVCGYRIEEIANEFEVYKQCRLLKKPINELARGRERWRSYCGVKQLPENKICLTRRRNRNPTDSVYLWATAVNRRRFYAPPLCESVAS